MQKGIIESAGVPKIIPRIGSGRPFAGDKWAREHPEEARAEEMIVQERVAKALADHKAGRPVSFGDLFAGAFTTRVQLNVADKFHRQEWDR